MDNFIIGMLSSLEADATDGVTAYSYLLKLSLQGAQKAPFEVGDHEKLSRDLHVGEIYEMVLLVKPSEGFTISSTMPQSHKLYETGRTFRMKMNEHRAIPEEIEVHYCPIAARVLEMEWHPPAGPYLVAYPGFAERTYVLLETGFGRLLMYPEDLEVETQEPVQPGCYLEWKSCWLTLLAASAVPEGRWRIKGPPRIVPYMEEVTSRMMGLPLLDILRQGVETWNAWRATVQVRPNFREVDLSEQNLSGVDLNNADLLQANLQDANLSHARFGMANLMMADLSQANLSEATLSRTNLSNSDLAKADLAGADLNRADLWGANLRGANLRGADLSEAQMGEANLSGANLSGANLDQADLSDAILDGADLRGAIFTEVQLAQVRSARDLVR
jgi:Pentapeptide repeats (8 copies)